MVTMWSLAIGECANHKQRLSQVVEAVGIEQPAIHLIWTILERFRGQVSMRTRPKNTRKTRYRTFL